LQSLEIFKRVWTL